MSFRVFHRHPKDAAVLLVLLYMISASCSKRFYPNRRDFFVETAQYFVVFVYLISINAVLFPLDIFL